jgi:hypothetical protein
MCSLSIVRYQIKITRAHYSLFRYDLRTADYFVFIANQSLIEEL